MFRHYFILLIAVIFSFVHPSITHAKVDVTTVTSPTGLTAWVIEDHQLPIVALKLAFKHAGSMFDPAGKEGLALMASSLFDEGAGELSGLEFKHRLESKGIELVFDVDEDHLMISLKTTLTHYDDALALLALALHQPSFDHNAITRIRKQLLVLLKDRKQQPGKIASDLFRETFFKNHDYSKPLYGTQASVNNITKQDLESYLVKHITRNAVVVSAAGAIPDSFTHDLDTLLSGLPIHYVAPTLTPLTFNTKNQKISHVMDIPQTTILFGLPAITRTDPDFYPAYVLNYILGGGGFQSRMMKEIREKRGLAYSAYSYLDTKYLVGLLKGHIGTKTEQTQEAITLLNEILTTLSQQGVAEEELANAKQYLLGSYVLKLDKNEKLADYLLGMQIFNLPQNFINQRNELIAAVTLEDVNKVANKLLNPDKLTLILVGKEQS